MLFGGGILLVLVGLGFIMPAVALLRDTGALPAVSVGLLLLGIGLTLGGAGTIAFTARRRWA
jgi:hypothetical protein